MRIAVLCAASLLVAGCSQISGTPPRATQLTPISPSRTTGPVPTTSAVQPWTSASSPSPAPAPAAPVAEVIDWVKAASPVDGADFRVALRGGTTTALGDDVAFTTPSGTSCMTDATHGAPGLACLVNLIDPPRQPADVYGAWKGGWVDFDGSSVQVGSAHGDPGRFAAGQGAPLPVDRSLSFGDFRCRTDTSALVCVNFARQTAVYYSDSGIHTFGCTRQPNPPAGVGERYTC